MADFLPAFEVAMQHEVDPQFTLARADRFQNLGLFQDSQTGEVNKWGVTLKTLRSLKWPGMLMDVDAPPDPVEIDIVKKLTVVDITEIYRLNYWAFFKLPSGPPFLQGVGSQIVASKIFDMEVHRGCGGAAEIVQTALRAFPGQQGLKVDGNLGPLTLKALNSLPPSSLVPVICSRYKDKLEQIIYAHPVNEKFRNNWMARAIWPYTETTWNRMTYPPPPPTQPTE